MAFSSAIRNSADDTSSVALYTQTPSVQSVKRRGERGEKSVSLQGQARNFDVGKANVKLTTGPKVSARHSIDFHINKRTHTCLVWSLYNWVSNRTPELKVFYAMPPCTKPIARKIPSTTCRELTATVLPQKAATHTRGSTVKQRYCRCPSTTTEVTHPLHAACDRDIFDRHLTLSGRLGLRWVSDCGWNGATKAFVLLQRNVQTSRKSEESLVWRRIRATWWWPRHWGGRSTLLQEIKGTFVLFSRRGARKITRHTFQCSLKLRRRAGNNMAVIHDYIQR